MTGWVGAAPVLVRPARATSVPARKRQGLERSDFDEDQSGEEDASSSAARNRQKELQEIIVAAEDTETILSTVRELEGAIVISTALHRLGKAGTPRDAALGDPRFLVLLEKLREKLPFFGARQIANSLHGLGSLCFRGGGAWVTMVSVQTQRRIRDFEPQHVSNTLWACARMQLHEPLMLRALLSRAIEDIGRSCPLDVSIVTWACATLKLREVEWLRAVVRSRLEFADFSPQNMSNFVWGLATLGLRNDNMVLACGREASRKIQGFIPQELSNFCWALATLDLCDNLMLRAVAEEVDRRHTEIPSWDPQSLSNMMWAYATLAIKDDPLFKHLVEASVARIADHDTQNLANSSWAMAMVSFRCSRWLHVLAEAAARKISECQTLHLAQIAFALVRFSFSGAAQGLLPAMLQETLRRVEEFAPQSLFDVFDALVFFNVLPQAPSPIERRLGTFYEDIVLCVSTFAKKFAHGQQPSAAEVASYRRSIEQKDVVTLGVGHSTAFLKHFQLLCPDDDPFVADGRHQILKWRASEAEKDPTSRSVFHRAQCAWQLGVAAASFGGAPHASAAGSNGGNGGALADGVFESGEPKGGGPESHGLVVCRLRHPREGDAEIQALCAALSTHALRNGKAPKGLVLNLHLSDIPCVSCLGATLQFGFRFPGMLRVSFDRGRRLTEDTVPVPRPPPPPSRKGNPLPYAPLPNFPARSGMSNGGGEVEEATDRSMLRRSGPDCRQLTSFYGASSASNGSRRHDGAAMGGNVAVPHRVVGSIQGKSQQTYYFSAKPDFYGSADYDACGGAERS